MKIQCSCGAKYEFELTPAMSTRPVSFVCPVCGVDASDFVDSLVRRELGQSNSPSGPPVSITTETPGSATGSTGIPIEKHPPTALRITRAAPVATSQESEPDLTAQDYDAPVTCSRHPAEVAMEKCCICSKPICPRCMELFGYVCSPLCKAKADSRGIHLPVYQGKRVLVEARLWRKLVWTSSTVGGLLIALGAFWFWYNFFGSAPKVVFSVRFAEPAYSGQSVICGKDSDQIVFLHGNTLARHDIKAQKAIWSRQVLDHSQIEQEVERQLKAMQAIIDKANSENPEQVPKMPSREKLLKQGEREAEAALSLYVRGKNIWVASPGKLVRYDWDSGQPAKEMDVQPGASGLIARGDELVIVDSQSGKPMVTHIDLDSCQSRTEDLTLPEQKSESSLAPPGRLGSDKLPTAQAGAGLLGTPSRPLDPAKVAEQAQHMSLPSKIALPATLAGNINQERALNELNDDQGRLAADTTAQPQSSFSLIPTRDGFVALRTKVLEAQIVSRTAMRAGAAKSTLDGTLTAGNSMAAANDQLNELQRSRGGDVIQEDLSRYEVTVRRPGVGQAWVGEVIGPPRLYPLQTVDVLAANKLIIVLDKSNRKLWESSLAFNVVGDSTALDAASAPYGQGPCVERNGSLYVFDQGVLTAFDLANGNARWRLPSVGIAGLFFDDRNMMYVNATTASHDSLKYSRQIDLSQKVTSVVLKVDTRKGKILWSTQSSGMINYVSGKFIFAVQQYMPEEDDNPYKPETGFEAQPFLRIRRLNPANGHEMWQYFQQRAPLDIAFDKNTIRLVFKKEVQVLRMFSL